jgi:tRNA threonylcarbamoyladenosine biosynthesis protein TsaE
LRGRLGTGKTTFARGLAAGLGVADPTVVASPSFTLVNVYAGRCPIYHVDLYRVEEARELDSLGLDEFLGRDGVTVIEWAERLTTPIEADLAVDFEDAGGDARRLLISGPAAPRRAAARRRSGTKKRVYPSPEETR